MSRNNYSYIDLVSKYKFLGLKEGDNIFATTGLGFLGNCIEADNINSLCNIHLKALLEIIGEKGTLIVPTYSYTFGETDPINIATFDVINTKAKIGPFPNFVLKDNTFSRSIDPMVSITCKGPNCSNIISNIPKNSYGHNSVFARMLDINTKCLSIGLGPNWTPFIHYLDYLVSSEFRYDKLFYGKIKLKDSIIKETFWNYSVPVRIKNTIGDCHKLGYLAEKRGIWNSTLLAKGSIYTCNYKEYFEFSKDFIKHDPWCTARGPKIDLHKSEIKRINSNKNQIKTIINSNIFLEDKEQVLIKPVTRNTLKKEFEVFSNIFKDIYIDYYKVRTGSNCGGYIVPEGWHPLYLCIKEKNGEKYFESNDELAIKALILPHSRSVSDIPFSKVMKEYKNLSELVINNVCKPNFSINICNLLKLRHDPKSLEGSIFSFDAEYTLSFMEVIALIPNSENNSKEIFLIDSISFDIYKNKSLIELIKEKINSGKIIILGPLHIALHSYINIYNLDPNKLVIKNLIENKFENYIIKSGPNIANNKEKIMHETIRFENL